MKSLAASPSLALALFAPLILAACSGSAKDVNGGSIATSGGSIAVSSPSTSANASVSGGATPVPTATPTLQLTPRPGAPVSDLATAQRLESEGDLLAALDAYVSLAPKGSLSRIDGVLGAGRVLLALDRPTDARDLLEPFFKDAAAADAAPAHYLLGRAYTALKLPDKALAEFDAYVQSGRAATVYAQYDRALALLAMGQPLPAALAAQNGLNANLTGGSKRSFTLLVAQSYEAANQPADALRWYQTLFDSSPGDEALALSKLIAIKKSTGDSSAPADIQKLLGGYASSSQAFAVLNDLVTQKQPVDPYLQGLVLYRQNDYTKAEPFFNQVIAAAPSDPSSAEAYYFLAAIAESQSKDETAVGYYARAQTLNPISSIADDALWWRGRLLESDGKFEEAATAFNRLVTSYPTSSWAADGAFQAGMLAYDRKDYKGAAQAWGSRVGFVSNQEEMDRLGLWQGKSLLKAKDTPGAQAVLGPITNRAEDDYYGIRAAALLLGLSGPPKATVEKAFDLSPAFDWPTADDWLAQKTGRPVTPASSQAWSSDPHWKRATELWLLGRSSQADAEVFDLISTYASDSIAMYSLARKLAADSHISMSARAGQRLLRTLNTRPAQGLPRAIMSLSYPAPYAASLQRAAGAQKVSPLLMLAVIRQESFFDPSAESGAGAVGLTQLLPVTARTLAPKVDITSFDSDQLTEADVNLRIGAAYLAQQLKDFDGSILAAFSAYNAGPNATTTWYKAAKSDADEFVEQVEFAETRLYVRIVAENYAIYRYLYAGEKTPTLPSD
jgi:soluble lytic murein transglycosylase-like protein/TolA-binding protein